MVIFLIELLSIEAHVDTNLKEPIIEKKWSKNSLLIILKAWAFLKDLNSIELYYV